MKNCKNCGDLPIEDFYIGRADRFCKECIRQQDRVRNATPERKAQRAVTDRMYKYGLSEDAYQSMVVGQNNECAICSDEMKTPYVDHCHTKGHVRGLLCNNCNRGIGFLQDNANILESAADYLRING